MYVTTKICVCVCVCVLYICMWRRMNVRMHAGIDRPTTLLFLHYVLLHTNTPVMVRASSPAGSGDNGLAITLLGICWYLRGALCARGVWVSPQEYNFPFSGVVFLSPPHPNADGSLGKQIVFTLVLPSLSRSNCPPCFDSTSRVHCRLVDGFGVCVNFWMLLEPYNPKTQVIWWWVGQRLKNCFSVTERVKREKHIRETQIH